MAVVLLDGLRHGRRRDAEAHHFILIVHYEANQLRINHRNEFFGVFFNLLIRQFHRSVQAGIANIDQIKYLAQIRCIIPAALQLGNVQAGHPEHTVGKLLHLFDHRLIIGHVDQEFHPVNIFGITQAGQVVDIIGMIVIGDEHALFMEAFHQHAFPVQIGKAQRTMHFIAALSFAHFSTAAKSASETS